MKSDLFVFVRSMPRIGLSLSKIVARAGAVSNRIAFGAVKSGRVTVNGEECRMPARRVLAGTEGPDVVELDGVVLTSPIDAVDGGARMWRYHKPRGLLTTHDDPEGRPTVFEALPAWLPRVISAGRLDGESEGLLMLTTSGSLARELELPSSGFVRVYEALVATGKREVTRAMVEELLRGLRLGDGTQLRPITAQPLDGAAVTSAGSGRVWVRMELTEGKNREVRRIWSHFGFPTLRLARTSYGPFELGDLEAGELEEVSSDDVALLLRGMRTHRSTQGHRSSPHSAPPFDAGATTRQGQGPSW